MKSTADGQWRAAPCSRRDGMRLLLATIAGIGATSGSERLAVRDVVAGKKHLRRCKRRRKRCKRQNRQECQACRTAAPPPPPEWTESLEEWLELQCGITCLSFCSWIWCSLF